MKTRRIQVLTAAVLAIIAVTLFAWMQDGAAVDPGPAMAQSSLTIVTQGGQSYPFSIEVPQTDEQMMQGLMFRKTLAQDAGMLFLFPGLQTVNMWMKNTLIPLDMLFMDASGIVVDIHPMAEPLSEDLITSAVPALAVLELPGGTAARLGIEKGDHVLYSAFDGAR